MLGTQAGMSYFHGPTLCGAGGGPKAVPDLQGKPCAVRAAAGGYVLPCIFALPPSKTGGAYERMWRQVRLQVGGARN